MFRNSLRCLALWTALACCLSASADRGWEPDRWPAPAPGVYTGPPESSQSAGLLARLYRWYRVRSDKDGAMCAFYPTCSGYGYVAVQEWGLWGGSVLVIDRLLREHPNVAFLGHYPIVTPHDTPRLLDPVPQRRRRAPQP